MLLLNDSVVHINPAAIARRLGWLVGADRRPDHVKVNRLAKKLEAVKLVTTRRGIRLTPAGRKEAERAKKARDKARGPGIPDVEEDENE
jgi:Mn-dependent DtxR family transcriptional regulator